MASIGPLNPNVVVSASGGDFPTNPGWGNTNNAKTHDGLYAEALMGPQPYFVDYLRAMTFAPNIGNNDIVNGIVVEIEKKTNGLGFGVQDYLVRLWQNNIPSGNNKKLPGEWTTSFAYYTYGSPTDTWGLTLTGADINASGFGVGISPSGGGASDAAQVDHIRITYYYTPSTSGSNNNLPLYITGFSPLNNNLTVYEQGKDTNNNNIPLFISPFNNNNNNLSMFEQGYLSINNNTTLFISSLNNSNNNFPLYIGGLQNLNILSPFTLFEQGFLTQNNNLPLFVYGNGIITNLNPPLNLPLYISGNTVNDMTYYFPLFIGGYTNFNNLVPGFTLFEQGDLVIASGLPLYIYGQQSFTTTTPPPNILPLYITGPATPIGYIPLYISGPQLVRMCQFTRYINMVTRVNLEI